MKHLSTFPSRPRRFVRDVLVHTPFLKMLLLLLLAWLLFSSLIYLAEHGKAGSPV